MNKLLGNNCAKGCLIYFVALVALLMVAAMGLDGLRARFGGAQVQGVKPPEYTIQSTGNAPTDNTSQPTDNSTAGGGNPTPTLVAVPPPPLTSPQPAATPAPSQAQGGTITGDAGKAFHIVESGDTLWAISNRFGVTIDDLRTLNNLTDDIIYPNQVIYLPAVSANQVAPTPEPSVPDSGAGGDQIGMPSTGIVKRP